MTWRISAGGRNTGGPAVVRHQEAVPVAVALDAAGDHRDAPGGEEAAGAVLHHLPGALQFG